MERTNSVLNYNVDEEPIVLSKSIIDLLLKDERFSDMLALYVFYYHTAKWQRTNQPRATVAFVANGISWGIDKVQLIRSKLKSLGLIEDVVQRSDSGKLMGNFVRVNFIWHNSSNSTPTPVLPPKVKYLPRLDTPSNALSVNSGIIGREATPNTPTEHGITPKLFEEFWEIYPRKTSKGGALTAWTKLCRKPSKDRPTWHQIKRAIKLQIKSDRWQDAQFIPYASTWLNQSRWLDDPKEMVRFSRNLPNKEPFKKWDGMRYDLCPDGKYRNKAGAIYIE